MSFIYSTFLQNVKNLTFDKMKNSTMEPVSVQEILGIFGGALYEGMKEPRQYNGTNTYKPTHARFKMKIWYRDGNSRVYYSFDSIHKQNTAFVDEYEGLKKLIRLGHVHHKEDVRTLVIWATLDPEAKTVVSKYDHEILKVTKAGMKENKAVNFKVNGNNNILDLQRLVYYSNMKL